MTPLKVYVAAPYIDAPIVRDIHVRLSEFGIIPTSTWAFSAQGAESFSALPEEAIRRITNTNDDDVRRADALLVVAREEVGGEMFAEARIALEWGKPVVWLGRRILSAHREGVVRAEDLDDAIGILVDMQWAKGVVAG